MLNNDLTNLLGPDLITAGFRLFIHEKRQYIFLNGHEIRSTTPDALSLKLIKRYCRLYLRNHPAS